MNTTGFLAPVISRIESKGGRGEWGDGGEWEAEATNRTQTEVLYLQYVTWNDTIQRVGQDCRWEQFGTPWSPINALQS